MSFLNCGWIGVDLDGTLVHYEPGQGVKHVGEPIPEMVERAKRWIAQGTEVRIMTARVCGAAGPEDRNKQLVMITEWCVKHLGAVLQITHEKDFSMLELWDDRAVQIVKNTGLQAVEVAVDETIGMIGSWLSDHPTLQGCLGVAEREGLLEDFFKGSWHDAT